MHFYCYSAIDELTIATSLGEPDYSYYFVLKAYRPLLEALGTLEIVPNLDDAFTVQYHQRESQGEACYVFAFAPPHKIPRDLPYRVIPVFAWEYSTLPSADVIGDETQCWVSALTHFGEAICHSVFAKNVVLHDVGSQISIESIPAPLWDSCGTGRKNLLTRQAKKDHRLSFSATVIDTRNFEISPVTLYPREGVLCPLQVTSAPESSLGSVDVDLGKVSADVILVGFYSPEGWGAWSKVDNAWIQLPRSLARDVRLRIPIKGFGQNIGREIFVHIGDHAMSVFLTGDLVEHEFEINVSAPVNFIRFSNIDHSQQVGTDDTRNLGIGVSAIQVEQIGIPTHTTQSATAVSPSVHQLDLSGIVYTAILNPRDGRKNWTDLLTAFCYAFRHETEATLILKMTCKSVSEYLNELFELLCQLHPFAGRVIVLHGYLETDEFEALLENSSFVVNASRGEGQCLPLMEFMSSGIPAIAPENTAMADYITSDCAFIVESTPEPTFWPHDNNQLLTTYWHRPSWESLFDAYATSFRVGMEQPEQYSGMARVASERLYQFCSIEVLSKRLRTFLQQLESG